MNRRLLLVLALMAAVAVVLVTLTGRSDRDPAREDASAILLPGLSHGINQVERIRLTAPSGDGVITLERHADGWSVAERDGYPADAGKVRQLLIRLSEARSLEEKTADPAFYERLGVEDVSSDSGSGVLVEISGGADTRLIVGKQEPRSGRGTYVRSADSAGSLLVDQELSPGTKIADWVVRDITDIPESRIVSVDVTHADGNVVEVRRDESGAFKLANLPDGREVSAANGPATLARTLSALNLDDVRKLAEGEPPADAARALFVTEDGRLITASLWEETEERLLALDIARAAPAPQDTGAADAPSPETPATGEGPEAEEAAVAQVTDAELDAERERLSGWVFRIPVWKYDQINRRLEDLLVPLPEAGED
jgi:hypothetical protein